MKKGIITKLIGGLFAVGVMATALVGQAGPASADSNPGASTPQIKLSGCVLTGQQPNLKLLGGINFSPDYKTASVTFKNESRCATQTGFWISVRFNYYPGYQYLYQPAMAAQEVVTRTVDVPVAMQGPAGGTREITFLLDYHMGHSPLSAINESNENDNAVTLFY